MIIYDTMHNFVNIRPEGERVPALRLITDCNSLIFLMSTVIFRDRSSSWPISVSHTACDLFSNRSYATRFRASSSSRRSRSSPFLYSTNPDTQLKNDCKKCDILITTPPADWGVGRIGYILSNFFCRSGTEHVMYEVKYGWLEVPNLHSLWAQGRRHGGV